MTHHGADGTPFGRRNKAAGTPMASYYRAPSPPGHRAPHLIEGRRPRVVDLGDEDAHPRVALGLRTSRR